MRDLNETAGAFRLQAGVIPGFIQLRCENLDATPIEVAIAATGPAHASVGSLHPRRSPPAHGSIRPQAIRSSSASRPSSDGITGP